MKSFVSIILTLVLAFSGCMSLPGSSDEPVGPVCNEPYMRLGNGCCLDKNGNGVCDRDETRQTSTTLSQSTTTVAAQQSAASGVSCTSDRDCPLGEDLVVCEGENVLRIQVSYACVNAGTEASECVARTQSNRIDRCTGDEVCFYGVCVDSDEIGGYATTTVPDAPTTTTPSSPTTTLVSSPTSTLAASSTTTTTEAASPMGETTSTTLGVVLPCTAFPAWSSSQCDGRTCVSGNCVYLPSSNPMLPGSCACKSATTTTLAVALPCSGFPALKGSTCDARQCPEGKECTFKSSSTPFGLGYCVCKTPTTTTLFDMPHLATTLTVMPLPTTTLDLPVQPCSSSGFPYCAIGICPMGQICETQFNMFGMPIGCECEPISVGLPTTTSTLYNECLSKFPGFCGLGVCPEGEVCTTVTTGMGVPGCGCVPESTTTTTTISMIPITTLTVVLPAPTTSTLRLAPVTTLRAVIPQLISCSDVKNPTSQSDCDVAVCSKGYDCRFSLSKAGNKCQCVLTALQPV